MSLLDLITLKEKEGAESLGKSNFEAGQDAIDLSNVLAQCESNCGFKQPEVIYTPEERDLIDQLKFFTNSDGITQYSKDGIEGYLRNKAYEDYMKKINISFIADIVNIAGETFKLKYKKDND